MIAKVQLWGRTIGAVSLEAGRDVAAFEYDQMTLNGKRDGFTREDFVQCARSTLMKRGRAATILEEVQSTVERWPEFAAEAGVPDEWRDKIQKTHRLSFLKA